MKQSCESCLMPFNKDRGKRESEKYCSMCYTDGKLLGEGMSLKEFQKMTYKEMVKDGMNPLKSRLIVWMIRFAPRWKS